MNKWIIEKILRKLSVKKNSMTEIKIGFYMETVFLEIEKLVIIFIMFTVLGFCADITLILSIMLMLRTYIGGTHRYTFFGCLLVSILFCANTLFIAKCISVGIIEQIVVTIIMLIIIFKLGPVTSKYRPRYEGELLKEIKRKAVTMIIAVNSIYVLLNQNFRNEVTVLLFMLEVDVFIAYMRQSAKIKRKEQIVYEKEDG